MARALKVYHWLDMAKDSKIRSPEGAWVRQIDCIVAAYSKAEVGRIMNEKPTNLFNLSQDANDQAVETALTKPGVVFWKFTNELYGAPYREGL